MHLKKFYLGWFVAAFCLFLGCGKGQEQQGGDHVPEEKSWSLSSLPHGSAYPGAPRTQLESTGELRRFLHFRNVYNICAGPELEPDLLLALESKLTRVNPEINDSGLEAGLGWAFGALARFQSGRSNLAVRPEFHVVALEGGRCDFLVLFVDSSEFPFDHADFAAQDGALFQQGQLRAGDLASRMAVGFVRASLSDDLRERQFELLVAQWLGLGSSGDSRSILNPQVRSGQTGLALRDGSSGLPKRSRDAAVIFAWVATFQDLLRPAAIDSWAHWRDRIAGRESEVDPLLDVPEDVRDVAWTDRIGDPDLFGVRTLDEQLVICGDSRWEEVRQRSDGAFSELTDFLDTANDVHAGIWFQLRKLNPEFASRVRFDREEPCNLFIAVRNKDEFPFANRHLNGMYAGAGSVRDKEGRSAALPIIWLNASNLVFKRDEAKVDQTKKFAGDVLQHEFAHWLGLKHSQNADSILSPAGYNSGWTTSDLVVLKKWLDLGGWDP